MKTKTTFLILILIGFVHNSQSQNFITEWTFPNASTQLRFNTLTAGGPVNYTWSARPSGNSGSGSFTQTTAGEVILSGLTIPAGNVVTLSMAPTNLRRFYMTSGTTNSILTNVTQWGSVPWSSMQFAFVGSKSLQISATDIPNLTGVTNMSSMFRGCTILNGPSNINDWNISAVTDIYYIFQGCSAFNQDIGNWNTTAVTDMSYMFLDASAFNQNIGNWDTSAVKVMRYMFGNASAFNQNIGNWNTAAVKDMFFMFGNASAFNQDISNWNTSAVTEMNFMLASTLAFNQNIGKWILNPNVTLQAMLNLSGMDCNNYSATLIGWAANNPTVTNRNLGALNRIYGTSAVAARTILVNNRGWIINDSTNGDLCGGSLSTLNYDLENQISIYPNPANEYLTINYKTNQKQDISVYSSLGKLLATYNNAENNFQVPVAHLANGLYFVTVRDDSGNTATLKFVKNN